MEYLLQYTGMQETCHFVLLEIPSVRLLVALMGVCAANRGSGQETRAS